MDVFVRKSRPVRRSQIEELIRRGTKEQVSQLISWQDKLDILHDSSPDKDRRDISGQLASKLPSKEVLDAMDEMNSWKDKVPKDGKDTND